MSHVALRRVMIRLLHDPGFVERVYADPGRALADVELTAAERAWVTAPPRAAWRTDPGRPGRVLAALADEYPATCALAPEHAATFFRSDAFHAAVQERGSLAEAFGEHARAAADSRVRAVARLEQAIALVRRASAAAPIAGVGGDALRLAPSARVVRVPTGALAVLADARAGRAPGAVGAEDEAVLVVAPAGGEVTLEPLAPALAELLAYAAHGAARTALVAEARRLGAEPGEDAEIVDGLLADGLLVAGRAGC